MKVAEALAEPRDCHNRIEEMKKRLTGSSSVQEGDQPAENLMELLAERSSRSRSGRMTCGLCLMR